MKVLIICSRREYSQHTDFMAPFIYEQMKAISELGIKCITVLVDNGLKGYLRAIKKIKKAILDHSPDIVHAHYGLCGLIANLQRKIPVVTTYHGTDLHNKILRIASNLSILLSKMNIVVSNEQMRGLLRYNSIRVIPCGVNSDLLTPIEKEKACLELGWEQRNIHVLFSKEFHNKAKNYPLARAAVNEYNLRFSGDSEAELLEFIGYSREQVPLLYNAVDCALMTSDHEGSPQFIKEAMACNCPIVSVDVGDVKSVIAGIDGCYLAERTPKDIASKMEKAIKHGKTNGRHKVLQEFDSRIIARKVIKVYEEVLSNE